MATTIATLQNLNTAWQVPDDNSILIDLTKQSGILQTALVRPSSHGNKHKYKYWNNLPSGGFRSFGVGIVPSVISKDTVSNDLWEYADLMQGDAGEVMAHPGGKAGWLRDNVPAFLEGAGNKISTQIIYGTTSFGSTSGFLGFHQYAKNNSKVTAQLSGSSGSRTSIFAVRWDQTNGASLRVWPQSGRLIEVMDLTPSQPVTVTTDTTTGAQLPVYQWWVRAYFTLVIPAATAVAAITQIDATHLPTAQQFETLIAAVRKNSGNIVLYGNDLAYSSLIALKYGKLSALVGDSNLDVSVAAFNGTPFVLDQNILSTETTDLD